MVWQSVPPGVRLAHSHSYLVRNERWPGHCGGRRRGRRNLGPLSSSRPSTGPRSVDVPPYPGIRAGPAVGEVAVEVGPAAQLFGCGAGMVLEVHQGIDPLVPEAAGLGEAIGVIGAEVGVEAEEGAEGSGLVVAEVGTGEVAVEGRPSGSRRPPGCPGGPERSSNRRRSKRPRWPGADRPCARGTRYIGPRRSARLR